MITVSPMSKTIAIEDGCTCVTGAGPAKNLYSQISHFSVFAQMDITVLEVNKFHLWNHFYSCRQNSWVRNGVMWHLRAEYKKTCHKIYETTKSLLQVKRTFSDSTSKSRNMMKVSKKVKLQVKYMKDKFYTRESSLYTSYSKVKTATVLLALLWLVITL